MAIVAAVVVIVIVIVIVIELKRKYSIIVSEKKTIKKSSYVAIFGKPWGKSGRMLLSQDQQANPTLKILTIYLSSSTTGYNFYQSNY